MLERLRDIWTRITRRPTTTALLEVRRVPGGYQLLPISDTTVGELQQALQVAAAQVARIPVKGGPAKEA